jgi:DNA-binding GntR family transcriptional regulator
MAQFEMFALGNAAPELDRKAPSALHSQISDAIRSKIVSQAWPPHHRLASEPDLAAELGVSRGTLRRALSTLIDEGLLKQIQGRGTFVTPTLLEPAVAQKLSTLSEDFASQGVTLVTIVVEVSLVDPPGDVGALLRVPRGQKVLRLVRLRCSGHLPIALLHNYVRADLVPGIEHSDFAAESLFGILEEKYQLKIGTARRTFSAQAATSDVALALNVPGASPVQYLEQLTFLADGTPIEYSDVWIRSSELRVVTFLARR